ncbi:MULTISPECIES: cytidylate kinase-like family protein [Caproicibacterium]|uniref:Cytidylate kinase-like family protein n=1 Tax=Caproicibacterium argilliputei TaxID=3030016 RepID=A0AA97DCL2_9FIRM|nr:cytidylate kinase-like family protein [Caproicibacterium argilliputei]WOC33142.1 cytidylate kinase-like family protein [Caproicibacterium argilliputei]
MSHRIISISRQFGSGGHEISQKLAQALCLPAYDKDLITRAAQESGLSTDVLAPVDEQYDHILDDGRATPSVGLSTSDTLFLAQTKIIRRLARQEDCIIVGRCSDVILLEEDVQLLRVFIHAPLQERIARIQRVRQLTTQEAERLIRSSDKQRRTYYSYYTDTQWGIQDNYDVSLNSAYWGIEKCVDLLTEAIQIL